MTGASGGPRLFEPITLRDARIRNRLWVAPMCQYSAADGVVGSWHLVHLAQFASGGAGVVMAEATAIGPEARITPWCPGIWNDEQQEAWALVAEQVRVRGALPGIQLAHAGRRGSTWRPWDARYGGSIPEEEGGWETVGPSALAQSELAVPAELTAAGIEDVVEAFRDAATRAVAAGFGLIEVHAAHGYLLHEFLSPLANRRADEWGGPLENRARLLLDVVAAVREEVGERLPVSVRLSARDWAPDGLVPEDVGRVAAWAVQAGADLVDVSTGGIARPTRREEPGWLLPDAAVVKAVSGAATAAVGRIDTPALAESVVADGVADVVMSAREWLRDPHYGLRAADELGADPALWPVQYERARLRIPPVE